MICKMYMLLLSGSVFGISATSLSIVACLKDHNGQWRRPFLLHLLNDHREMRDEIDDYDKDMEKYMNFEWGSSGSSLQYSPAKP